MCQVRDTGTVDINPDADLKELQARNLTEKEKEVRAEFVLFAGCD